MRNRYYDRKKKVLVICLAGARSLLQPEEKNFYSSVSRVRDYYYFYHGSNLREIIQFLCEIECIEFECNEFVLGQLKTKTNTEISFSF